MHLSTADMLYQRYVWVPSLKHLSCIVNLTWHTDRRDPKRFTLMLSSFSNLEMSIHSLWRCRAEKRYWSVPPLTRMVGPLVFGCIFAVESFSALSWSRPVLTVHPKWSKKKDIKWPAVHPIGWVLTLIWSDPRFPGSFDLSLKYIQDIQHTFVSGCLYDTLK